LNLPIRGRRYLDRVWVANVLDLFYPKSGKMNVIFIGVIFDEEKVEIG
jgi:hypothetical protein